MTHLDLFSGIGGFALAAKWAGYTTIGFCEKEEYARRILARHWPGAPIHGDIRELDGSVYRGVTLITGGFPCQPFSVAGQQAGKADDRYLWPEMLRVIAQAQPAWVVAENVAGIISMALDQVLADLEGEGYACGTVVLPACGVGAPHRRDRVWIIAHANSQSEPDSTQHEERVSENVANTARPHLEECQHDRGKKGPHGKPAGSGQDVADTSSDSTQGLEQESQPGRHQRPAGLHGGAGSGPSPDWWAVEPPVGRVANGISRRVDRLKGLGNAIVPQVAYEILKSLRGCDV